MLDVAIGLSFIFLFVSLIVTMVNELLASVIGLRAKNLALAIGNMLNDPQAKGYAQKFFNNPLITTLAKKGQKPSYIPSATFVTVFLDTLSPGAGQASALGSSPLMDFVPNIADAQVQKTFALMVKGSGGDLNQLRDNLEQWFNDTMDRASGWYKRRMLFITLAVGVVLSIGLNVDTLSLGKRLYTDSVFRSSLVTLATTTVSQGQPKTVDDTISYLEKKSAEMPFVLGDWSKPPEKTVDWVLKIMGWALTSLAVSLGSPFWFDQLGKFIKLRGTGAKPDQ